MKFNKLIKKQKIQLTLNSTILMEIYILNNNSEFITYFS